jgi:hypothetical protein
MSYIDTAVELLRMQLQENTAPSLHGLFVTEKSRLQMSLLAAGDINDRAGDIGCLI